MSQSLAASYDEMPYRSRAFYEAHPDRLATLAILHGLTPPPIPTARVLELGCAGGGHLIPMAVAWPEAKFLGLDLSPRQIETGQALIESLGLTNIELRVADLTGSLGKLGTFDYILCHGVYSWVAEAARQRILTIASKNLAPHGLAYVSFNTYPGWHGHAALREMMLFHVGPHQPGGEAQRVAQARALIEELAASLPEPESPYGQFVRREAASMRKDSDDYILHEYLDAENGPVLFSQFLERAAGHKLRYLADARYRTAAVNQPPAVRASLERLSPDPMRQEQYLDFLRNRNFRRAVLVPQEREPKAVEPAAVEGLRALAAAWPATPQPSLFTVAPEDFVVPNSPLRLTTIDPLVKVAMMTLCESWPRSVPISELWSRVDATLAAQPGVRPERSPADLNAALLSCFAGGVLELHASEPAFALDISDRPQASPFAVRETRTSNQVTNLRHRIVELGAFDRLVLGKLDGTRDQPELIDELVAAVLDGSFPLHRNGQPITDPIEIRDIIQRSLDASFQRLRGSALLVG